MDDRIPLVDGPCAGQTLPAAAIARNLGGTFLFVADDKTRHQYGIGPGKLFYVGPYDGPWLCDATKDTHDCRSIIQPNEETHPHDHTCCCGFTWPTKENA